MNEQPLQSPMDPPEVDSSDVLPTKEEGEPSKSKSKRGRKHADPLPDSGAEELREAENPVLPQPVAEGEDGLEIPVETGNQPDAAPSPDPAADQPDSQELEQLRKELTRLREEIRSARKTLIEQETELEEFRNLFPDVSLSSLPDSVLQDVQRGIPLAAAYALMQHRRQRLAKIAEETNAANNRCSAGSAEGSSNGFLSIAEVRAMTPEQVRKHYQQILLSMPKWH